MTDTLFPLVLVAKKEYLESLQKGFFYMKNCLCYQAIEGDDIQRGDKYDGAVKCGYKGYGIPESLQSTVTNPRLMEIDNYIKCFFHYQERDMKMRTESCAQFAISSESQKVLREFNEEYALVVFNAAEFVRRFSQVCEKKELNYYYGDIKYATEDEYERYKRQIEDITQGKAPNKGVINPVFVKRDVFENQQEFRFCIKHKQVITDGASLAESISIDIGNIQDISVVVKLSDICRYPIIMDYKKEVCYIVDSSNEGE